LSSRVRTRIDIAAPIDVVFAFFDDLANAAVLGTGWRIRLEFHATRWAAKRFCDP